MLEIVRINKDNHDKNQTLKQYSKTLLNDQILDHHMIKIRY